MKIDQISLTIKYPKVEESSSSEKKKGENT